MLYGLLFKTRKILRDIEGYAGIAFLVGILASVILNCYKWHKDRFFLKQITMIQAKPSSSDIYPSVSIIVAAWNESEHIEAFIVSTLKLRYPNKQLVVCAGGTDQTFDIARRYATQGVVILEQVPGEGKQAALARCYEHAIGEVIFLTDADCRLEDDCFERTLAPIIAGEQVATGSWRPLERQQDNLFVQFQWSHNVYRELQLAPYISALDGRNTAIRRMAIDTVDRFRAEAPTGTDYLLAQQLIAAGYQIRFVPESRVQTEYPETIGDYWRQQGRWFRNPIVIGRKYGQRTLARAHIRSGIIATMMLLLPGALWFRRKSALALWCAAVSHLYLASARMLRLKELHEDQNVSFSGYLLLPVHMLISWSAMARGLIETIVPRWHRNW